jgi:cytochrome c oxidase assembly factor CtaG
MEIIMLAAMAIAIGYMCSTAADRREARERMKPIGRVVGAITAAILAWMAWMEWG